MEITKTKPIFWVQTFISIITLLLAVVVLDIAKVTYPAQPALISILFLFLAGFYLDTMDPSGHKKAGLLSLIPTIATAHLLPIFASFFGDLKLELKNLKFLRPGFFYPSL